MLAVSAENQMPEEDAENKSEGEKKKKDEVLTDENISD